MATFSAKNFPDDSPGNKALSGIGERTIYAPVSKDITKYNYANGFVTSKSTPLVSSDGYVIDTLSVNKKVYFTYPAKLYKDL